MITLMSYDQMITRKAICTTKEYQRKLLVLAKNNAKQRLQMYEKVNEHKTNKSKEKE